MADIKIYGTLKNVTNEPIVNAEQIGNLATVATSGSYNDLNDKPTIPTKTSDLNNDSKFVSEDDIEGEKKQLPGDEYSINITDSTVIDSTGRITSPDNENLYAQISSVANYVLDTRFAAAYMAFLPSGGTRYVSEEIEVFRIHIPIDCTISSGIIDMSRGSVSSTALYSSTYFYIYFIDKQGIEQKLIYALDNSVTDRYLYFSEKPREIKGNTDIIIRCKGYINGSSDYTEATRAGLEENLIIIGESKEKYIIPTKTSELVNDAGYLTQHQDISGKQDVLVSGTNIKTINNNSIVGSGNLNVETITGVTINNTTKTPTNGTVDLGTVLTSTTSSATNGSTTPITSGGVYTALQNYEKKLSFTSVSSLPTTCVINTYYRITSSKTSLAVTLPSSSLTAGDTIGISFTAGSSITTPTVSGGTIYKQDGWSDFFEATVTYEIVALYDGEKWLVTSTKFNS